MRIADIDAITLRYAYPAEQRFKYAGGVCDARLTTLIVVRTEDGRTGIGSVYSHPGMVHLVVRDQLAPLLRGEDAGNVEDLWEQMYGLTRWYGRKGAAMSAIGGIDTALWDLRGQARGTPLWRLLGGSSGRCPAYASGLLWKDTPQELADEAASYIDRGFRGVKMRLARSESYDRHAVTAVRKAIGPDNRLMIDASMRYHLDLAGRMGAFFAEQGVFWYEEPFAPENLDAFAALRDIVSVPLAAGENEFGVQGFRELVRSGAVDILQPEVSRSGGVSEVVKVAQLADEHGLSFATHSWSDAVTIVANAHIVAAMDNGITVEIDQMNNPFVNRLLGRPFDVRDGHIELGEAPGLGIELDWDVVESLRLADPLTPPPGVYSDMMFGAGNFPSALPYLEG